MSVYDASSSLSKMRTAQIKYVKLDLVKSASFLAEIVFNGTLLSAVAKDMASSTVSLLKYRQFRLGDITWPVQLCRC